MLGGVAAFVSGAGGGIVTGLAAIGVAPDRFDLSKGLGDTLRLCAVAALWSGVSAGAAYLRQSPLPPPPAKRGQIAGPTP